MIVNRCMLGKPHESDARTRICEDKYDRRKVLYHPGAVAKLLETGDCWPVTVNTGFTTYCNHSCAWCSSAYTTRVAPSLKTRDQLLIQPEVWGRNLRILAAGGTSGLIIAGQGEPLFHPAAQEMLGLAAELGLKYMLFTNGERLTAKYFDTFFGGAIAVRFSVDAATAEMHERHHAAENANGRGRADFARVVENIRALVEEKRRRGTRVPDIGCQMICSSLTEPDFEDFARLFRDIGVDYVVYKSLQTNDRIRQIAVSPASLQHRDAERQEKAAAMVARLLDIKARYQRPGFEVHVKADQIAHAYVKVRNGSERYRTCRAHPLTPMIEPDGNVYLCIDHGGDPDFVIGNIYEDPFDVIWTSQRRKDAIARIDLDKRCPAGCFLDETNVVLDQLAAPDPHLHTALI